MVLLLAPLLLAGCGVGAQERPTEFPLDPAAEMPRPALDAGPLTARVYFVSAGRLEAVEREVSKRTASTALALLVAGPTRAEVASGIRTAIAPQSLMAAVGEAMPHTVVIAATPDFTSVTGGNQLLAVAQLVWTVTDVPGISHVRVEVDGQPVEVPTDDGLTGVPVDRRDYMSVAPEPPDETPAPSATPTTSTGPPVDQQGTASPTPTTSAARPPDQHGTPPGPPATTTTIGR